MNRPLGIKCNNGDLTGIQFALYEDRMLHAIARLDKTDETTAQTKFVGVDTVAQGKEFGKLIMLTVETKSIARSDKK